MTKIVDKNILIMVCIFIIMMPVALATNDTQEQKVPPRPLHVLNIKADTEFMYVDINKSVTFVVTRECGTEPNEVCATIYPPVQVPASGVNVYLEGVSGSGKTDKDGKVVINILPTNTGNIKVTANKPGFKDGYTIIKVIDVPSTPNTPTKIQKFRVGPTVKIRPLNDIINKSSDGLIELYMDNPSLNDLTLSVDARISVPSGIHVTGEGFGDAGAAGTVYGTFDIPPGKARTIYVTIKADKTGDFNVQFSGMYWPGDNKDDYQPISLTHSFRVDETSSNNIPLEKKDIPALSATGIVIIIVILALFFRK